MVYDGETGRYQLRGPAFLPATSFDAEEALALIVLCHELGDGSSLPFYGAARRAAMKIESALPVALRDHLRAVAPAVHIRLPPSNPLDVAQSHYQQLLEAVGRRRCVRIHYDAIFDGKRIRTKLSPYRLLFSRRSWYVIGRSSLHRAVRTFNVGRILSLEPTMERYWIPRTFSLGRYLRNAWHLIPEPGPDHEVTVRFSRWWPATWPR